MFQAKFKVNTITDFGNDNIEVRMIPIMGEDNDFTKYTPSGEIKMMSLNPRVNKQLAPGKTFLVTFTRETET